MNDEAPAEQPAIDNANVAEGATQFTAEELATPEARLSRIRAEIEALTKSLLLAEAEKEGHAVSIHLNLAIADLEHLLARAEIVLGLKKA